MTKYILTLILFVCCAPWGTAQIPFNPQGNPLDPTQHNVLHAGRGQGDTIDNNSIPTGLYVWQVDRRFGDIQPSVPDTLQHLFYMNNQTAGPYGQYNYTGNLGAPRISQIFADRNFTMLHNPFIFTQVFDYFLPQTGKLLYTNTRSPFSNITYHTRGNRINGEDRLKVLFATNVNKRLGLGFSIDYLYGRGVYANQATSMFDATIYGSYIANQYQAHFYVETDHIKMAENGGVEDDAYITSPEGFSSNYGTADLPTKLDATWNRLNRTRIYLSHRYNIGITRQVDTLGNIIKEDRTALRGAFVPSGKVLNAMVGAHDSMQTNATSVPLDSIPNGIIAKTGTDSVVNDSVQSKYMIQYIPITSFIHTFSLNKKDREFTQNNVPADYYTQSYFETDTTRDKTRYLSVNNLVAISLHEGFNKWIKTGMKLFAEHEYRRYQLPTAMLQTQYYNENYFTLGAQLYKRMGHTLHYDLLGELVTTGQKWGMFNITGQADLNIPVAIDTLRFTAYARLANERPSFYYRHYHGRFAWWDNKTSLRNLLTTRIGGTVGYRNTRIAVDIQSIQNYTYLQEYLQPIPNATTPMPYTMGAGVEQLSSNLQILGISLLQDFNWGPLHWENRVTYQASSQKSALALPTFTGYTNLYLKFKIAKVLDTEIGANATYFTEYTAPVYLPYLAQFATQSAQQYTSVGNLPIINAYANFHLRQCRFYIMASHVNHSSDGGRYFLVPHYPINGLGINLGVSWTFLN